MRVFASDDFAVPLPPEHRFPMAKYAALRRRLLATGVVGEDQVVVPRAATDGELLRVHGASYLRRVVEGTLTAAEVRRIGFPWSPELVERSRRSCGGTVEAAFAALSDGVAVNLAGGTHHAFADRGEGFCVFNDVAVAVRALQAARRLRRAVVVDCDVHQGNGTASIFAGDPDVFTFSIHGASNFPFRKERSDLDIALPDGTGDAAYLGALADGIETALRRARAEMAFVLAGSDPFVGDRYGRMSLSAQGLARRDAMVFARLRRAGLPVAVAMAGGYARDLDDTVTIQAATVAAAAAAAGS